MRTRVTLSRNARDTTYIYQRTEGPESCQDKFLADALLNEAMSHYFVHIQVRKFVCPN